MSPVKGDGTLFGFVIAELFVTFSLVAMASIQFGVAHPAIKAPKEQRDNNSTMPKGTWLRRDSMVFDLNVVRKFQVWFNQAWLSLTSVCRSKSLKPHHKKLVMEWFLKYTLC